VPHESESPVDRGESDVVPALSQGGTDPLGAAEIVCVINGFHYQPTVHGPRNASLLRGCQLTATAARFNDSHFYLI